MMKKVFLCLCLCIVFLSACNYDSDYVEDDAQETVEEESKIDEAQIKAQYVRLPKNEGEIQYEIEEKKITFDDDYVYLLANDKGIYFFSRPDEDAPAEMKENKLRVWYKKYEQEEQTCVFEADNGHCLVASVMTDRGEAILKLNPGSYTENWLLGENINEAKMLFRKDEMRLPEIAVYQDWIYVSYTLQKEGKSVLYKINLNDLSKETIYETSIVYDNNTGRATGERIVFSGGTEECLYFQILGLKNQYDEECEDRTLYKYQNGEISKVMNPNDILVNICGVNDKLLIAEYATDEPWLDTCSIIDTDTNEVLGVVEDVDPVKDIRKSVVYDNYILFTNYYNMYIYDTVLNKLEMIVVEDKHSQIEIYENKFSYYNFDKGCVCIVSVR